MQGGPVKHLLVDLDGTILGNRNLNLSLDFLRQVFGLVKDRMGFRQTAALLLAVQREFARPSQDRTIDLRVLDLIAKGLDMTLEETRGFVRESLRLLFPTLERHFFPIEGAKEFLDWARTRYTLTLATNPVWPREIIELRVKWAGLDPAIFGNMTTVRDMHACKPTPEYYREILEREQLQARDCLLVGNELKMDLPATRVGIRVFIVEPRAEMTPIKARTAKIPAWRGGYRHLRELLETESFPG